MCISKLISELRRWAQIQAPSEKGRGYGCDKYSTALCGRSSLLLVTNPIEELKRRSIPSSVRNIISHGGLASEVEASTHARFSRSLVSLSLLLTHPYRHIHVTYKALDAATRWMISTGWIKTRHPALGELKKRDLLTKKASTP
jgi:hypothetical protein